MAYSPGAKIMAYSRLRFLLGSGFGAVAVDRGRLLAGRISHSLAPADLRFCPRQDQMPIVRCSVCIKISSMGSEGLPELWL